MGFFVGVALSLGRCPAAEPTPNYIKWAEYIYFWKILETNLSCQSGNAGYSPQNYSIPSSISAMANPEVASIPGDISLPNVLQVCDRAYQDTR